MTSLTRFTLAIGGIGFEVRSSSQDLIERMQTRYADYETHSRAGFLLELSHTEDTDVARFLDLPEHALTPAPPRSAGTPTGAAASPALQRPLAEAQPTLFTTRGRLVVKRSDFVLACDPDLRLSRGAFPRGMHFTAVESMLRIVFAFAAVHCRGLLLHAAGVAWQGHGCVFPGCSGTGKSTIARLTPPDVHVLSDESVLVVPAAPGAKIYSTPFHGTNEPPAGAHAAALKAICFPVKDARSFLAPVPRVRAMTMLLRTALFFGREPSLARRLMQTAQELLDNHSHATLHFSQDASLWACVKDAIRGVSRERSHCETHA